MGRCAAARRDPSAAGWSPSRAGRDRTCRRRPGSRSSAVGLSGRPSRWPASTSAARLSRVLVSSARERLADVLVGDHLAGRVEPGAAAVDRGGALRVPGDAFVAHVLHAHRAAEMLGEHGGVGGGVALVVAAVGAGAEHPDRAHLFAAAGRAVRRRRRPSHRASASRSRSSPRRRARRRPRRPDPCWHATGSGTRTRLR